MNENDSALKTVLDFLLDDTPLNRLPSADAIFVFGNIDPEVARHAALLYKLHKARRIIVSGKGRVRIPNFKSEAAFFANILMKKGVPKSALILEDTAMNSLENVQRGIAAAKNAGLSPATLILVAIPPLLRRSRATFEKQFPKIKTFSSAFRIPFAYWKLRRRRLLGEFDRFTEYEKNGNIARVKIPSSVARAVTTLRRYLLDYDDDSIDTFYPTRTSFR